MGAVFLGFPWLMGHEQLLGQDYAAGNQPLQGRKENAWIKTVSERPASLGVLDVRVAFKWESFDTGGTATVWWLHLYAPRSTLHSASQLCTRTSTRTACTSWVPRETRQDALALQTDAGTQGWAVLVARSSASEMVGCLPLGRRERCNIFLQRYACTVYMCIYVCARSCFVHTTRYQVSSIGEREQADAGRDESWTRLARPNSLAQTGTGKCSVSLFSWPRAELVTLRGWSKLC